MHLPTRQDGIENRDKVYFQEMIGICIVNGYYV